MSAQLKPCPMCGSDKAEIGIIGCATFWVECSACGACSASHDDEYDARAAWNTRPGEDVLRQQRDELAYFIVADPTDSNCLKVVKAADAYLKEGK